MLDDFDPETPDHDSPVAVGDRITVTGRISFTNQSGGTTSIPRDAVEVEVIKAFWDYEAGWRYHGRLMDDAEIDAFRAEGQSSFDADWYRQNYPDQPHLAESSAVAFASFDPAKVYFDERMIAPSSLPTP